MSTEKPDSLEPQPKPQKSQADIDAFFAKIDLLRAENEAQGLALVRSWMTPSTRAKHDLLQKRTQSELDAEDARLFKPQPTYLGVGAEVPAVFLASESQSGDKRLRQKLLPARELKASKRRSEEEKEESRKRAKGEESEEEEGRSGLGKKKRKVLEKMEREPSAVNPLIANGLLQNGEHEKESKEETTREDLIDKVGQRPDEEADANHEVGEKKRKKKRKKSKHTLPADDEEGVAVAEESAIRQGEKTGEDVEKPTEDASVQAQNAPSTGSSRSKEQRKAEKKARKEERRRLKALAE